ncbi:unnamed protein product [Knipowitschia caucasica]
MAFPPDSAPFSIGVGPPPPPPYDPSPMLAPPPAALLPELAYLAQIDRILIQQKVNYAEMVTNWEMSKDYILKNSMGQQVFTARESGANFLAAQFFGLLRPFDIHIVDNFGREILTVIRPVKCGSCCFPCCLQEVEIQSPPGVPIGYIEQNWHPFWPKFTVTDANRSAQLKIKGPCCDCTCCSDVNFDVLSLDEDTVVGQITKQWAGFLQEGFTDADNFGVSFPMDLDVRVKAVLLGAVFLIDFMYFETNKKRENS